MAKRPTPFNNPFASVGKELKRKIEASKEEAEPLDASPISRRSTSSSPPLRRNPSRDPTKSGAWDDSESFRELMRDATPIDQDPRGNFRPSLPPPTAEHVRLHDEETEVYEELLGLIDGRAEFDIEDSDEFIEGAVAGLDRRVIGKLRRGEFAVRAHLDLHGLTREEAKDAVERFLGARQAQGQRAVLIVHGRGLNSKDNIPVLKGLLRSWLERGRIADRVLAFATARPHDGGAGAVYVLLRRPKPQR